MLQVVKPFGEREGVNQSHRAICFNKLYRYCLHGFLFGILFILFAVVPTKAFAATEFITTVNTDGGGDYASLAAWQTAIHTNLTDGATKVFSHGGKIGTIADGATVHGVTSGATGTVRHVTATQILISGITGTFQNGEQVYQTQNVNYVTLSNTGDSAIARVNCSGVATDTAAVVINGWVTSATNYYKIVGNWASSQGINIWDVSKYKLAPLTDGDALFISDSNSGNGHFYNLQIYPLGNSATSVAFDFGGGNGYVVANNIINGHSSGHIRGIYNPGSVNSIFYRNYFYNCEYGIYTFSPDKIYNNTIYNCSGYGIRNRASAGSEPIVENNAVFSNTNNYSSDTGNWGTESGYNSTNSTTAPGSNNQVSKVASNQFISLTAGQENLHLKAGADSIDTGTNLGSPYDYDIDNTQVTGTWDIGADEYVESVPPTPGIIYFSNVTQTTINATTTGASDNVALAALPFRYHNVTTNTYYAATSTSITFTGLTPNTSYTFEVGVEDLAGNWATSTQQATTTLNETNPPTPGTISFSNVTATTITATTTGASDDTALAVLPFRYHNVTTNTYYAATSTPITFTGLTPNTSYSFEVGVQDLAGNWATSTLQATTTLILTHTITASAGSNGSISPSGSVSVVDGAAQAFTITPNLYYGIATLLIDGSPIATSTSYNFANVTTVHAIAVTFQDVTPPAAVSDLSVSCVTYSSCNLTWTAPGDDGNTGTSTSYDIRYSTSSINDSNWASVSQATGEPAPQVAGSIQTLTVSGLTASTTYYFAMKTSDEVPNTSAISNLASGTTPVFVFNVHPYTYGDVSNLSVYPISGSEPAKGSCLSDSNYNTTVCKIQDANDVSIASTGGSCKTCVF